MRWPFEQRGRIDEVYVLMGPSSLSAQLPGTHTMRQNILDIIDRAQDHLLIVGYMLNLEEVFQRVSQNADGSSPSPLGPTSNKGRWACIKDGQ